jgi:hypothetical protein
MVTIGRRKSQITPSCMISGRISIWLTLTGCMAIGLAAMRSICSRKPHR